ncbi:hypothetical protein B0A49_01826 [Cryomyces minteri]|uniref:BTB domain-containing protein n=1 Tax=Cryomyces minteri TaxID=331657 RepID=A0A4U0XUE1_9PEZI|nr:hypothetical protein B0A49_01826 [Cryomyces minteri]
MTGISLLAEKSATFARFMQWLYTGDSEYQYFDGRPKDDVSSDSDSVFLSLIELHLLARRFRVSALMNLTIATIGNVAHETKKWLDLKTTNFIYSHTRADSRLRKLAVDHWAWQWDARTPNAATWDVVGQNVEKEFLFDLARRQSMRLSGKVKALDGPAKKGTAAYDGLV